MDKENNAMHMNPITNYAKKKKPIGQETKN